MNHTTNYQLSQWVKSDQVLMEDFNADNAKLDAALTAQAGTLAAHTEALSKLGNCQLYTTTYVGTGESGANSPNTLTFPQKPALVVVGYDIYFLLHIFPHDFVINWNHHYYEFKWSGNTISWYSDNPEYQLNEEGKTYCVLAFWAKD